MWFYRASLNICAMLLLTALLAGCGTIGGEESIFGPPAAPAQPGDQQPQEQPLPGRVPFAAEPIRVAILLPLTGQSGPTGQALLNAATMALFEAVDPRITLMPFDTQGSADRARIAARDAIDAGAVVVLGPLFSDSVAAAAEETRPVGVPLIGFSNDRRVAGSGAYLLSFMPRDEVRHIVRHAVGLGKKRIAALIPETDYGTTVFETLSDELWRTGATLAGLEIYPPDPQSLFDPVRRLADYDRRRQAFLAEESYLKGLDNDLADEALKEMENLEALGDPPFDAVLIPEGGEMLRTLVPLLPFFEVDPEKVLFLGTGLWDDRSLTREPPMHGARYASAPVEATDAFMAQYESVFGDAPPRIATLAYDAMALVARLARHEVRAERFSRAQLENPNGFVGVDGPFRFLADGTSERKLAIIEIDADGFHTVAKADPSFMY